MTALVAMKSPAVLLFDVGDDLGVIWEEGQVWAPRGIHAILARGYWNEPEGIDPAAAIALLAEAQPVGPEWTPESLARLKP